MTPQSNRRVSARKVLRRPATVKMPGGLERVVRTWDVGLDGMSLVAPKPIPPGTRCSVAFELPEGDDWRPVEIQMKTVYCSLMGAEGVKVGVVFATLAPDTERLLKQFID